MARKGYVGVRNFIPRTLPSGYTQIEYIQSSGTQYINTGFAPNQNTRVVMDFQVLKVTGAITCIFGQRNAVSATDPLLYNFWIMQSGATVRSDYFGTNKSLTLNIVGKRIVVDKNKNACKVGENTIVNTSATGQGLHNLFLLTLNDRGTPYTDFFATAKVYSCQIYDNGVLVRDFVPCKNSSGVAGLYDLVNGVFYTNAGSGTFTAGPTENTFARLIQKGYIGVDSDTRALPSGYTQVKYLASNGNQFINTGFKPNQDTRVVMCATVHTGDAYDACLFGARHGSGDRDYALWIVGQSTTSIRSSYGTDVGTADYYNGILGRHIYDKNKNTLYIDGVGAFTNVLSTFSTDHDLYLLECNNGGSALNFKPAIYLHYCRIYDNDVLVRDFVPCKNSSGVAGLYDLVNGVFYTNAGSGTFGTGTIVTDLGVARKIKAAYIGIGGVARPCWPARELAYFGTITPFTADFSEFHVATTIGNYALFAGGSDEDYNYNAVEAYDTSLAKSTPTVLSRARYHVAAANNANYALIAGGCTVITNSSGTTVDVVDAYNASLVRTTTTLGTSRMAMAGTRIGNYALFAGGVSSQYCNHTDAFNQSLARSTPTALSTARSALSATTVGDYALFAGGSNDNAQNIVDAYNKSLTRSTPTKLSVARIDPAATAVGDYALFAGGKTDSTTGSAVVDAYNQSLTRSTPTALSQARVDIGATTLGDNALFGGGKAGYGSTYYDTVDAYDKSLTRSTPKALSKKRSQIAAATVGNYALFAGGYGNSSGHTVDAYVL